MRQKLAPFISYQIVGSLIIGLHKAKVAKLAQFRFWNMLIVTDVISFFPRNIFSIT